MNPLGKKLEEMYKAEGDIEKLSLQRISNKMDEERHRRPPSQEGILRKLDGSTYFCEYSLENQGRKGKVWIRLNDVEPIVSTNMRNQIYPSAVSVIQIGKDENQVEKRTMDTFVDTELKFMLDHVTKIEIRRNGVPNLYWKKPE